MSANDLMKVGQKRLQPSLLDRLTDDDADSNQELREKRVLNMRGLRRAVLRDLEFLFNSTGLSSVQDLSNYSRILKSVINFGFPDVSGKTASGLNIFKSNGIYCKLYWFSSRASYVTLSGFMSLQVSEINQIKSVSQLKVNFGGNL